MSDWVCVRPIRFHVDETPFNDEQTPLNITFYFTKASE